MSGDDGKNGWRDEELADLYTYQLLSLLDTIHGYYLYVFTRQAGNLKNVNQ